jgi:hypothetical protein
MRSLARFPFLRIPALSFIGTFEKQMRRLTQLVLLQHRREHMPRILKLTSQR